MNTGVEQFGERVGSEFQESRLDWFTKDRNLLDANRALLKAEKEVVDGVDTREEIRRLIEKLCSLRADARNEVAKMELVYGKLQSELSTALPSKESAINQRMLEIKDRIKIHYQPIIDQPPFIVPGDVVKVERSKKDSKGAPIKEDWDVTAYDEENEAYSLKGQKEERDPSSRRIVKMRTPVKDGISVEELERWNATPMNY